MAVVVAHPHTTSDREPNDSGTGAPSDMGKKKCLDSSSPYRSCNSMVMSASQPSSVSDCCFVRAYLRVVNCGVAVVDCFQFPSSCSIGCYCLHVGDGASSGCSCSAAGCTQSAAACSSSGITTLLRQLHHSSARSHLPLIIMGWWKGLLPDTSIDRKDVRL